MLRLLHDTEYLGKKTLKQHVQTALGIALGTISFISEVPPSVLREKKNDDPMDRLASYHYHNCSMRTICIPNSRGNKNPRRRNTSDTSEFRPQFPRLNVLPLLWQLGLDFKLAKIVHILCIYNSKRIAAQTAETLRSSPNSGHGTSKCCERPYFLTVNERRTQAERLHERYPISQGSNAIRLHFYLVINFRGNAGKTCGEKRRAFRANFIEPLNCISAQKSL